MNNDDIVYDYFQKQQGVVNQNLFWRMIQKAKDRVFKEDPDKDMVQELQHHIYDRFKMHWVKRMLKRKP